MSVTYLKAIFDDQLQHPNWFDRRILTGTDLQDEQSAHVQRARYLGQGVGSGVVYGLDVTFSGNQLMVTKGLAISPSGDTLTIPSDLDISLVVEEQVTESTGSIFVSCDIGDTVTLNSIQSDFYILALTTASQPSADLAPTSTLNGNDQLGCIYKYTQVGVQFKLISLGGVFNSLDSNDAQNKNRSKLASECFGHSTITSYSSNPMGMPSTFGLLDTLRNQDQLTDCDVPLAALRFNNNAVQFVDMWAARRPAFPAQHREAYPMSVGGLLEAFTQFSSPRQTIEGIIALLQFQDQLEDLRTSANESPSNIRADNYFIYLPPAGYLPLGTNQTGFNMPKFFEEQDFNIQEIELDPAYLRQIFHDSFYVDPIRVGQDAIDVYRIADTLEQADYRIFLRRPRIVEIEPDLPPDDDIEVPTIVNGTLRISVVDEKGTPIEPSSITNVTATDRSGKTYYATREGLTFLTLDKYELAQTKHVVVNNAKMVLTKYSPYLEILPDAQILPSIEILPDAQILPDAFIQPEIFLNKGWIIRNLPPGRYSVGATLKLFQGISVISSVYVPSGSSISTTVVVRQFKFEYPPKYEYFPPEDYVLPDGFKPDRWEYDPKWRDLLDKYDPGWIDPVPDDWWVLDDPRAGLDIELWLGNTPGLDPHVVTADPQIWVRKGYNPDIVSDTIDTMIYTQDGSTFPLVMVAGDNALDNSTPLTRSELPDYDAGTYNKLNQAGLGDLDVMASAPSILVAAVLGHAETDYASNLIEVTHSTLRDDFQNGFMGYAGVNKATSDALKVEYDSKVKLANATSDALVSVLGADSIGYAGRLLLEVQGSVPRDSYSLDALGIGVGTQEKLAEIGVTTIDGMLGLAASNEVALKDALGTTEIDSILDDGLLAIAKSEFNTSPLMSIASLESVDQELASALVELGFTEAKEVANGNLQVLVEATGVSEDAMVAVIAEATQSSDGFSTLVSGVSGGTVTGTMATDAGFATIGSFVDSDANVVSSSFDISLEDAEKLNNFAGAILGDSGAALWDIG